MVFRHLETKKPVLHAQATAVGRLLKASLQKASGVQQCCGLLLSQSQNKGHLDMRVFATPPKLMHMPHNFAQSINVTVNAVEAAAFVSSCD